METVTVKLGRKHVALLRQRAKALGRSQGAIVRDRRRPARGLQAAASHRVVLI